MGRRIRMAAVLLCMLIGLTGCKKDNDSSSEPNTNTIILNEDGSFTGYVRQAFDESLYSFEMLQTMVNAEIDHYNTQLGSSAVSLLKCELEEGSIVLSISYATAEDYSRFNSEIFFYGTIREAVEAQYDLSQLRMVDASDQTREIAREELELMPNSYILIMETSVNLKSYRQVEYLEPWDTLVNAYEVQFADTEENKEEGDLAEASAFILHSVIFK